eukprot:6488792-Amphidinium_carterae.4
MVACACERDTVILHWKISHKSWTRPLQAKAKNHVLHISRQGGGHGGACCVQGTLVLGIAAAEGVTKLA